MAHEIFDKLNGDDYVRLGRLNYRRFCQYLEHIQDGTSELVFENGLDLSVNEVCYNQQGWVGWHVNKGQAPRDEALELHFMMVPKDEMNSLRYLTDDAKAGYWVAREWLYDTFGIPSCYIIERDGGAEKHAGAKKQAGFEVKVPKGDLPVFETFMKSPEKVQANEERRDRFIEFYKKGTSPDEFDKLVQGNKINKDGVDLVGLD